ncbi:MAG TPA: hypothetical protein C5S51_01130 [Methanosarcinaceae archaeon]|nr:hypothetical protein [Methanosarcinaceae archaeon]
MLPQLSACHTYSIAGNIDVVMREAIIAMPAAAVHVNSAQTLGAAEDPYLSFGVCPFRHWL